MRKTLLSFSLLLFTAIAAFAQAPQLFNYQGVARTTGGSPLANQTISLRLTIHDVSAAGTVLYQESHTVTTNQFGLYVVSVGNGTNTTGTFSSITWGTNDKYMQVEVDPAGGSSFATLGATQLLSVPYAVYSNTAGTALNFTGTVPVAGDVTGTTAATTVVKLQGRNLSATAPTNGEVLAWNSTTNDWEPSLAGSGTGTVTSITAGPGLTASTNPITITGTIDLPFVGTSGTYGSATQVPVFNTDAYGRVTSVTNTSIAPGLTSTGTINYLPVFTSATSIGNSQMYQLGTKIGFGTLTPFGTYSVISSDTIVNFVSESAAPSTAGFGTSRIEYNGTTDVARVSLLSTTIRTIADASGIGIEGAGSQDGVLGVGESETATQTTGTEGDAFGDGSFAVGVAGFGDAATLGPATSIGVYGFAQNGGVNYAGYFDGDVYIGGTLSGSGKLFKIDDPLDPANKYLYHSCVESPDMMNIYNGNITTDASGVAVVTLPDYFDALNKDFRYQLTVIGTFAQAIVSKEISGNSFELRTSVPNVKVSWQVTGVRKDVYATAHRVVPEVEKESFNKGKYLDAKDFGKSADLRIGNIKRTPKSDNILPIKKSSN